MLSLKGLRILLSIPIKLLLVLLKYPFLGGVNEKFRNDLINSLKLMVYRTALYMPVRESVVLSIMSNRFILNKLIKTLYPKLTNLPNYGTKYDAQSYWIVKPHHRKSSDPILIFLHGGGYFFETMPSQIESLVSIYHLLDKPKRDRLSMMVLDYKLASRGYNVPYQLGELLDTYSNLVKEGNDNFIFVGDSAGGNLAIIFLQYLKENNNAEHLPYPRSVMLISPWVKLAPDAHQNSPGHSYYDNSGRDMLQIDHFRDVDKQVHIIGDTKHDTLTVSPGNCDYKHTDWEDIPTLTSPGYSTFVILGEHECFRDDVLTWCKYALKSPLAPQKQDSNGVWNPKVHEYIKDLGDSAYVEINVEPQGVHDSVLYFENTIISKVKKNPGLSVSSLDPHKYFGIVKVVNFLNKTLPSDKAEDLV
ncbi:putative steryl acetyl hydrolase mug81 [Candida viswanathii]|uniref:Putative steryl acetyl hydrolase mug81 n=1 Tax=Candida viswanathii TaxID=5486 RepID=A0A367YHI7_9ASCO|nr:putative steryl acetyl hydrolase mug81 [Candida viswanathii]